MNKTIQRSRFLIPRWQLSFFIRIGVNGPYSLVWLSISLTVVNLTHSSLTSVSYSETLVALTYYFIKYKPFMYEDWFRIWRLTKYLMPVFKTRWIYLRGLRQRQSPPPRKHMARCHIFGNIFWYKIRLVHWLQNEVSLDHSGRRVLIPPSIPPRNNTSNVEPGQNIWILPMFQYPLEYPGWGSRCHIFGNIFW